MAPGGSIDVGGAAAAGQLVDMRSDGRLLASDGYRALELTLGTFRQ
jgi:hypothetical protein